MTLVELLVGLSISALLMISLATILASASGASVASKTALGLQEQARFALERMAITIREQPGGLLPVKANDASSGSWLLPTTYDLRPGTIPGTQALVETISGASRVLAEPVLSFSITSPSVSAGRTLIAVQLALSGNDATATASLQVRLGGSQ